ncbi:DUF1800 domain-containing protein [Actibacterium sp. XHP0104]|uniref:DUF1800 domain-containing protein n=1 Tax=Actibacterium sp. XHP0104 TaxID=2984335 RepID=UPI0021E9960C|nr:DUF1800 domain-containing protein [Actibacterium sp. XHP0104]MCV2880459.1 DUF1800 domain-containing protein [Actibacterium sp. XHP0104]
MPFDPRISAIRFGYGLAPSAAPPASAGAMLARLTGPDRMAQAMPIARFGDMLPRVAEFRALNRQRKAMGRDSPAQEAIKALRREMRGDRQNALVTNLYRAARAEDALRERLVRFWADHFTALGKNPILRALEFGYVEEAIRPNITGTFAGLLKAAVTHPMMLHYLDQARAVGPNAPEAKGTRGLNENLAREVLELHTLGVGAPYGQNDVRELAELFTGMTVNSEQVFNFYPRLAEPGAEEVLGQRYGGANPRLADIHDALDDLARHPATARHIASKLAVHFVADDPDAGLVDHIAAAYTQTGGDLMACYGALLDHPAAWAAEAQKARQPFDFVAASLRALDAPMPEGDKAPLRLFSRPMAEMGQPIEGPIGPDGWPEEAQYWITPQGMAARIQWAARAPSALMPDLPDPRAFAEAALGGMVPDDLRFAAAGAESRPVGVALVLASPAFQRR